MLTNAKNAGHLRERERASGFGETSEAWRAVLDDFVKRGLRKPEFLIVDGSTGLEQLPAVKAIEKAPEDAPDARETVSFGMGHHGGSEHGQQWE